MAKETMRRRASDNKGLHKDFHGALSCGIEYLDRQFGELAVRDFLREFTLSYYAPLRTALRQRGLIALKDYFDKLYRIERASVQIEWSTDRDELVIRIVSCPAVIHMRRHHYPVARLFHETTLQVNASLCEGTPYAAELVEYDPQTGRSVQRFYRRAS